MRKITVTLVANAGVLVEMGGEKLLIDALFSDGVGGFSAPRPASVGAIMAGAPPFDGVTGLLCTHGHPDHFDPLLYKEYLAARKVRGIALPSGAAKADPALLKMAEERVEKCYLLDFPPGV